MKILLDGIDDGNAISKLYATISLLQKRVEELEFDNSEKDSIINHLDYEVEGLEHAKDQLEDEVIDLKKELESEQGLHDDIVNDKDADIEYYKDQMESYIKDAKYWEEEYYDKVSR